MKLKVEALTKKLEKQKDKINLTDSDARILKGKKGNFDTYYNVQISCNTQQVILHSYVCQASNDRQQLIGNIEGVEKNTGQKVDKSVADAGYSSFDNLAYLEQRGIEGFIAASDTTYKNKPYHKAHFKMDEENDQLICPQKQVLKYHQRKKEGNGIQKIYRGINCQHCSVKSECTKGKARTVGIDTRQPLQDQMKQRLQTEQGKAMYAKRLHPVESFFGHVKFNLGYTHFLLRGLAKVEAEFKLMCLAFNLMKLFKIENLLFFIFNTLTIFSNDQKIKK